MNSEQRNIVNIFGSKMGTIIEEALNADVMVLPALIKLMSNQADDLRLHATEMLAEQMVRVKFDDLEQKLKAAVHGGESTS